MYQYLYLKACLVAAVFWLIIFLLKKGQRKELILMGIILGIAGPIQELWYTRDYWHPAYIWHWPWIESILFGFFIGGVISVVYEIVFSSRIKEARIEKPHPLVFTSAILIGVIGIGLFVPFMNSIYAAMSAFITSWFIIVLARRDLLSSSLYSASLAVILAFFSYKIILLRYPGLIRAWWDLDNISGLLINGIPLEEYLWFFTAGLVLGPAYELLRGIRFVKSKAKMKDVLR